MPMKPDTPRPGTPNPYKPKCDQGGAAVTGG